MNVAGHNSNFALPGCDDARTIRPNQARFLSAQERFHPHHVHHWNSFRDANYQLDSGIDRFKDRIRSSRRRHEHHRRVASGFLSRFANRVEYRHFPIEHLAALSGRDAGNHVGAVVDALPGVKRTRAARNALHNESRVLINQNRHRIRKAGKEEKTWKPRTHETNQKDSCVPALLICLLVSWFPDSFLFSLVNHQLVSVRVAKLRHPANWRLGFFNVEHHATLF